MVKNLFVAGALTLATALSHAAQCDASSDEAQTKACIADELRDSDKVINEVYGKLTRMQTSEQRSALKLEQRSWIKSRTELCRLDGKISDREVWIQDILKDYTKTVCVVHMTRSRIATLEKMVRQPDQVAPANDAPSADRPAFDGKKSTVHASGKWYYEFTLNLKAIADITPTLIVMGLSDSSHLSGTMVNVTGRESDSSAMRIGIAVDLDNGKLYLRKNGSWVEGEPGSNRAIDVKLGRDYHGAFMISAEDLRAKLLATSAFVPNFGDLPFTYATPDGYLPWRNAAFK